MAYTVLGQPPYRIQLPDPMDLPGAELCLYHVPVFLNMDNANATYMVAHRVARVIISYYSQWFDDMTMLKVHRLMSERVTLIDILDCTRFIQGLPFFIHQIDDHHLVKDGDLRPLQMHHVDHDTYRRYKPDEEHRLAHLDHLVCLVSISRSALWRHSAAFTLLNHQV